MVGCLFIWGGGGLRFFFGGVRTFCGFYFILLAHACLCVYVGVGVGACVCVLLLFFQKRTMSYIYRLLAMYKCL